MATPAKKKASAPAPKSKSEDTSKKGGKTKAAAPADDDDEDESEDEDEAPVPAKKGKASAAPAKKSKAAPEPEPEEDDEDEDEEEDSDEDEDGDDEEDEDEAPAAPVKAKKGGKTPAPAEPETTPYDELLDLADVAAKADGSKKFPRFDTNKEKPSEFLIRLLSAVGSKKLTDEQFDSLPQEAQDWFNASVQLLNDGKKKFPALAGFDPTATPAEAPKAEKGAGLAKWRAEQDKLRAEGKLPPKKEKKEPKGDRKPKDTGTTFIVREIVAANPEGTLEAHLKACAARGLDTEEKATRSTIGVTRSGSLAMIEALKLVGSWTAPTKKVKAAKAPEPEADDEDEDEEEEEVAPVKTKKKAKK